MKVILFFVLCSSVYAGPKVHFRITIKETQYENRSDCVLVNNEDEIISVDEGETVRVDVELESRFHIQRNLCKVIRADGSTGELKKNIWDDNNTKPFYVERRATMDLDGLWMCKLYFNGPNLNANIKPNEQSYTWVNCTINVQVKAKDYKYLIIWCVSVIVLIIIVGQTIALLRCHFKSKARDQNNLEILKPKRRLFDRNDRARYSAAPSIRAAKTNRAAADSDSHIYEMVGVNALYKDSSELEIKEMDIKNRPPLPLPGETPASTPPIYIDTIPRPSKKHALMASTLSLNSSGSNTQLIAAKPSKDLPKPGQIPSRPPKPDEKSLPGSLKRPPKPVAKSGSVPKTIVKDPGLAELKNALKKRNQGMASPNSSPMATLEKKQPPQAPKKPPPKQIVQPMPKPQPTNAPLPIKHGAIPPSQIKAKLEATLKPMSPIGLIPQANSISPTVLPVRPNPNMSLVIPNLPVASVSPVKAVPLPVNGHLPIPQLGSRPLPPIQQEEERSDDEEWTYEPLAQYNLYNV